MKWIKFGQKMINLDNIQYIERTTGTGIALYQGMLKNSMPMYISLLHTNKEKCEENFEMIASFLDSDKSLSDRTLLTLSPK